MTTFFGGSTDPGLTLRPAGPELCRIRAEKARRHGYTHHTIADALQPVADHERIETNGVELYVYLAGPADGPPVVLLNGFSEFWFDWPSQIPALAAAGYRVIAPDQRGDNPSDKPAGIDAYTIDTLAADLVGLLDALGFVSASGVGHDWGGGSAGRPCVGPRPHRPRHGDQCPHPAVFRTYVQRHPRQMLRSWYMLSFQLPGVAERADRAFDWRGLRWWFDTSIRPRTFAKPVLERYRRRGRDPGPLP